MCDVHMTDGGTQHHVALRLYHATVIAVREKEHPAMKWCFLTAHLLKALCRIDGVAFVHKRRKENINSSKISSWLSPQQGLPLLIASGWRCLRPLSQSRGLPGFPRFSSALLGLFLASRCQQVPANMVPLEWVTHQEGQPSW